MRVNLKTCHWELPEFLALARIGPGNSRENRVTALQETASQVLGANHVFPVNSGRGALALALSAAARRAQNRSIVLIPSYVCPAVPETITKLGLQPVTLPVGDDFNLRVDLALPHLNEEVL